MPVATIKRHATGKGNAPKEDVIRAMRAQGFLHKDDSELLRTPMRWRCLAGPLPTRSEAHQSQAPVWAAIAQRNRGPLRGRVWRARTLAPLPDDKPQSYFNVWPAIVRTTWEIMAMERQPMKIWATPQSIDRMDECFAWASGSNPTKRASCGYGQRACAGSRSAAGSA